MQKKTTKPHHGSDVAILDDPYRNHCQSKPFRLIKLSKKHEKACR